MPIDVEDLLTPSSTGVVTMEMQRDVVGDLSLLPELAQASSDTFPAVRRLLGSARSAGAAVVHCLAGPPVAGARPNYPLAGALAKRPGAGMHRPEGYEVVDTIGPAPDDLRLVRHHGMSPFTGTELDAVLRSRRVATVVACGVSLNVGIIGLAVEAVGLGYRVVVATDCVAGVPDSYAQLVLRHTVGVVATLLPSQAVCDVWSRLS